MNRYGAKQHTFSCRKIQKGDTLRLSADGIIGKPTEYIAFNSTLKKTYTFINYISTERTMFKVIKRTKYRFSIRYFFKWFFRKTLTYDVEVVRVETD